jgi:hypothetical protein
LILAVREASPLLLRDGAITAEIVNLLSDGKHLQKWPHHIDHVHVRFLETRRFTNRR